MHAFIFFILFSASSLSPESNTESLKSFSLVCFVLNNHLEA